MLVRQCLPAAQDKAHRRLLVAIMRVRVQRKVGKACTGEAAIRSSTLPCMAHGPVSVSRNIAAEEADVLLDRPEAVTAMLEKHLEYRAFLAMWEGAL